MKYIVILEETTIHRVEIDADSEEMAETNAIDQWKQGYLCDSDPYLDSLRALEVRTQDEDQ